MSPSSRFANFTKGEISVSHDPPREAIDYLTWKTTMVDGLLTVGALDQVLELMREDHVPGDATVQVSGPMIFAHWRRTGVR